MYSHAEQNRLQSQSTMHRLGLIVSGAIVGRGTKAFLLMLMAINVSACLTPNLEQSRQIIAIERADSFAERVDENDGSDRQAENVENRWWHVFEDSVLNALVDQALANNLDIQIAEQRLLQASEFKAQAISNLLPIVTLSGDSTETSVPNAGSGGFTDSTSYSAAAVGSLNIDLFGNLRNQAQSASLASEYSSLDLERSQQRIIAELIQSWIGLYSLSKQLSLNSEIISSFRSTAELTEQRYRAGSDQVSASDVQITRQSLIAALANQPGLETARTNQLYAIDVLLGDVPGSNRDLLDKLPEAFPQFQPIPIGTPAELLTRRPDVKAAELRYRAALSDVGAARARLFPGLSLTARYSFQDDDLDDLFDWDQHVSNLIASFTAPVFQSGRLNAQVDQAWARAREVSQQYSFTALSAVQQVESALVSEDNLGQQFELLNESVEIAEISNQISMSRYRDGLTSLLTVLETQRSLNSARQNLILTEQSHLNARVNLYLALGGDWLDGNGLYESGSEL